MRLGRRYRGLLTGVALCVGVIDLAARPETFVAGKHVRLTVDVPAGYSFEKETDDQGLTHLLLENPVWHITLSVYIAPEFPPEAPTTAWQRDLVVAQSSHFLAESKEQDYQWQRLDPRQGSGVFCVFTDAEAKRPKDLAPGGFMHVVVGAKVIKGAAMYFQIYVNDLTSPEYREIFDRLINSLDPS